MKSSPSCLSRLTPLAVALAALFLATGCTTRFVDYTVLSTKNVDLSKAGTFKRAANRVSGEDQQFWIIFIPTSGAPNVKEAADRAIESVPGAIGLVDGVVSARGWWFIFGESTYIVEGLPLIDPSLPGARASLEAERIVSFVHPETKQMVSRYVTEEKYQQIRQLAKRKGSKALSHELATLLQQQ